MAFSANPEDLYPTAGNIITPLKDSHRFPESSPIIPEARKRPWRLTRQEAWLDRPASAAKAVHTGNRAPDSSSRYAFESAAQDKDYVDQKSGVSARLPIAAMELLASAGGIARRADRRGFAAGALVGLWKAWSRPSPAKLELVYAGEAGRTRANIAPGPMIGKAVRTVFHKHFPEFPLQQEGKAAPRRTPTIP